MFKFTTPVSMQVTEEQYERDLIEPLKKLGYSTENINYDWDFNNILVTNYSSNIGNLTNVNGNTTLHNRHFIDHYNPQLLLALAAMTDEKDGIAGEYWLRYVCNNDSDFTKNQIYKAIRPINQELAFIDNSGDENGRHPYNHSYFRKATKEELINHFTKENVFSTNKTENMFKKGDYIVTLKVSTNASRCGKDNYCFKQREDNRSIHPEIDLGGSKHNGNNTLSFDKQYKLEDWRYATKEEIAEYDRLDKPFDVTTLKNSKEIIGYKLIKPEYGEAGARVAGTSLYEWDENLSRLGYMFTVNSAARVAIEKAGILSLWFTPIYKQQEQIFKVGNFEVKVKDGKAFHANDNITEFTKGLINHFKPQTFGKYMMTVEDVTFSKTGCQTTSKLSEWLEVFKALNK